MVDKMEITSNKTYNLMNLTLQELCILEFTLKNSQSCIENSDDLHCAELMRKDIKSARESIT
jgi:hypothetical protein